MLLCACAYGVKSEISLDTGDSASNAVFYEPALCRLCVFACYGLRVCGQKYIVIICGRLRKFAPRLNKHDDVIECNFMKIAPPRNEELVAPLTGPFRKSPLAHTSGYATECGGRHFSTRPGAALSHVGSLSAGIGHFINIP